MNPEILNAPIKKNSKLVLNLTDDTNYIINLSNQFNDIEINNKFTELLKAPIKKKIHINYYSNKPSCSRNLLNTFNNY